MNKIKPCPFCGTEAELSKNPLWQGGGHGYYNCFEFEIVCPKCGCSVTYNKNDTIYHTEEEAIQNVIEVWNKRIEPQESDKYDAAFQDGYNIGYAQARFDYRQKSTTKNDLGVDAVSRKELLKIYDNRFLELQKLKHLKDNKGLEDRQMGVNYCINILKEMPPVTPIRPKHCPNCGSDNREVKESEEQMDRLNKTISDVACILDSLILLRQIQEAGDCNICKNKDCGYMPKAGQMVRYNCPFYKVESGEREE